MNKEKIEKSIRNIDDVRLSFLIDRINNILIYQTKTAEAKTRLLFTASIASQR